MRGAADLRVDACDFSDNGGSVVPGPGLEHNLLLSHVRGAEVNGSRLDDSSWGSGIYVTESSSITISNSEAARNRRNGIHSYEASDIRILRNLLEANDGAGILLDGPTEGAARAEARENVVRNNGARGIAAVHAPEGVLRENSMRDNGEQ